MSNWFKKFKAFFKAEQRTINALQTFREFGKTSCRWWGSYSLEPGQSKFWRVGNVVICVDRFTNEWYIASSQVDNLDINTTESHLENSSLDISAEQLKFKTYTFKTQAEISLKPILADRPLASKLARPLHIPGDEEILLYVSSPVWVRIATGTTNIILDEIPTFILSDTWLSNNTIEGELCYSGHTHCSPHLKDIPSGPDRIISPMLIKNYSKSIFLLNKVSVPLPFLSVYSDADNFLWTEQLYVYRKGDDNPEVEVAKGPPQST